jgi:uncharacterized ferritin-like protein (DUF455 family)
VKLWIKEKGDEEGCMERNVHIGNKWWKIMTICQQRDEDNNKRWQRYNKKNQRRLYALGRGLQRENTRKRSKKLGREEREDG